MWAHAHLRRRDGDLALTKSDHLAQVLDADDGKPGDHRLRGILRRDKDSGLAFRAGAQSDERDSLHLADCIGRRQLAYYQEVVQLVHRHLLARGHQADGDGEVKAVALLLHIREARLMVVRHIGNLIPLFTAPRSGAVR